MQSNCHRKQIHKADLSSVRLLFIVKSPIVHVKLTSIVKSAYGPMWSTRLELIPVSVA